MQRFTDERDASTRDEIWLVEHPPVFTLGLNAAREHLLAPGDIPVVQIDRGGQVTYHGPGQLVIYPLIDVRRHALGVRQLVVALEDAIIAYAAESGIRAVGSREAPGVYVEGAKLASIGLRIRRGGSYHGVALNVSLDLEPFRRINVCGHRGLAVTCLSALGGESDVRARFRSERHEYRFTGREFAVNSVELFAAGGGHRVGDREEVAVGAGARADPGLG
jgi:lipoyl(octanoyl) transferase